MAKITKVAMITAGNLAIIAVLLFIAGGKLAPGAFSGERITVGEGVFTFEMPRNFRRRQTEDTFVLLDTVTRLGQVGPTIRLTISEEDDGFDKYDEIMQLLDAARYNRNPPRQLIRRNDVRTVNGIQGWELVYSELVERRNDPPLNHIVVMYLLMLDNFQTLTIEARDSFDNRSDFIVLCNRLLNSITEP